MSEALACYTRKTGTHIAISVLLELCNVVGKLRNGYGSKLFDLSAGRGWYSIVGNLQLVVNVHFYQLYPLALTGLEIRLSGYFSN